MILYLVLRAAQSSEASFLGARNIDGGYQCDLYNGDTAVLISLMRNARFYFEMKRKARLGAANSELLIELLRWLQVLKGGAQTSDLTIGSPRIHDAEK